MSLETVVEDIREEARARAEEIREEAEREAEDIIENAEAEADDIVANAEAEVAREIERERDQDLSSANLQAKQARLEARRDLLESVREELEEQIVSLEGERREELTRALLEAAAVEYDDGEDVAVYGREDDAELIEAILSDYPGFEYAGAYECLGGVVVESDESRLRVNNTFDSVLEVVWEDSLKEISSRLFEEQ